MGRNYAHMIVRNSIDLIMLESALNGLGSNYKLTEQFIQSLNIGIEAKKAKSLCDLASIFLKVSKEFTIKSVKEYYIINCERLSFETIEEAAKRLSIGIEKDVFYISYFENTAIVSGIYSHGECTYTYKNDECEIYGMDSELKGVENLINFFDIKMDRTNIEENMTPDLYETMIDKIVKCITD